MEPLGALGVAAAAVQLFDFASRVLKGCTDVCQSGKGVDLEAVEKTAKDLANLKESLIHQAKLSLGKGPGATAMEEQEKVGSHSPQTFY